MKNRSRDVLSLVLEIQKGDKGRETKVSRREPGENR